MEKFKLKINEIVPVMWTGWRENLKLCEIKETPHYHFLKGDKTEYNAYAGPGKTDRGHNEKIFSELVVSMSKQTNDELVKNISFVVAYWSEIERYVLLDGLHRMSILVSRGVTEINAHTEPNGWKRVTPQIVCNLQEFKK